MSLHALERKPDQDAIKVLEEMLVLARSGEVLRVGVVCEYVGGAWGTRFSASTDARVDGAMLIELGLRRLGFRTVSTERGPT